MAVSLDPEHPVARRLRPGERIQAYIPVAANEIVVTDRRVAVADEERLALDIEIATLRRIQFDIERYRPATLVIVPEHALDEPQVLAIPPDQLPRLPRRWRTSGSDSISKSNAAEALAGLPSAR